MSNLKKNLGYQTFYQILSICLSFIIAPYLSRVLGAKQLGIYSYNNSVVAYFTLIAMLGFSNHGTRCIASVSNDHQKCSYVFSSIYYLQLITSTSALICYIFYLIFFCKENMIVASIMSFQIISCVLDINWLFYGLEEFKITVIRNIFIRVSTVIAIFVLVKEPDDLWIYAVLIVGSFVLSNAVLWCYAPRYVQFVKVNFKDVLVNLKPVLVLFTPIAAMSIYHTMDKTMLGAMSNYEQSGFYYNADKVINIPIAIITGFGTVLLPRTTALISQGKKESVNKLFNISMKGTVFVASAMAFGIAAVAQEFVPIYFGEGYEECVALIIMLSPVLIIKGLASSVRNQYLIPWKLDSIYIRSVFSGAITNLFVNIALIPKMGAKGAVIGTLAAELIVCIYQLIAIRKMVKYKKSIMQCIFYILMGGIMFSAVKLLSKVLPGGPFSLIIEIIFGVFTYAILTVIYLLVAKDDDLKLILRENLKVNK